jgi:hypothetical protein
LRWTSAGSAELRWSSSLTLCSWSKRGCSWRLPPVFGEWSQAMKRWGNLGSLSANRWCWWELSNW